MLSSGYSCDLETEKLNWNNWAYGLDRTELQINSTEILDGETKKEQEVSTSTEEEQLQEAIRLSLEAFGINFIILSYN